MEPTAVRTGKRPIWPPRWPNERTYRLGYLLPSVVSDILAYQNLANFMLCELMNLVARNTLRHYVVARVCYPI